MIKNLTCFGILLKGKNIPMINPKEYGQVPSYNGFNRYKFLASLALQF